MTKTMYFVRSTDPLLPASLVLPTFRQALEHGCAGLALDETSRIRAREILEGDLTVWSNRGPNYFYTERGTTITIFETGVVLD